MFHKEDQIISVNGTFVKELSLAGVVELLAKSGSRVKIEFLTVHTLKEDADDTALSDRYEYKFYMFSTAKLLIYASISMHKLP